MSHKVGARVRCIAGSDKGLLGVVVRVGQRGHEYAEILRGTPDDHGPWCEVKFDDPLANREGFPIYGHESLEAEALRA